MLKSIFSFQELSELEALEVKGGRSGLTLQYQCSNSVVGCACELDMQCVNRKAGCACLVDENEDGFEAGGGKVEEP